MTARGSGLPGAVKGSILRGCRNNHIPGWNADCENPYRVFLLTSDGNNSSRAATALLNTHLVTVLSRLTSSYLSWLETEDMRLLIANRLYSYLKRCLISRGGQNKVQLISPESIHQNYSLLPFQHLKAGKLLALFLFFWSSYPMLERLRNLGYICNFFSFCLFRRKMQRRLLVIAIPKSMTPVENSKSYRPIALLCAPTIASRDLSIPVLSQLSIRNSLVSRLISTGEVNRRPSRFVHKKHRGLF